MLHVGGDSWYKNRIGTLELYSKLLTSYTHHKLVMVGPPPSKEQQLFIETHHLSKQVIFVESIDNETLRAFYSSAYLLLFPSHEEGFGWPIIEAQACGCPVAVIDRNPMREIAGPAGILLPETPGNKPDRAKWAQTSAEKIKQALELDKREALVEQGLANIKRFSQKKMVNDYLKVYKQLKA